MHLVLLPVVALLAGCSTIKTIGVAEDERIVVGDGRDDATRCDAIPRIYSGVAYEICELRKTPNIDAGSGPGIPLYLPILFITNAIADTVVLPWTIYRQFSAGSIPVE